MTVNKIFQQNYVKRVKSKRKKKSFQKKVIQNGKFKFFLQKNNLFWKCFFSLKILPKPTTLCCTKLFKKQALVQE